MYRLKTEKELLETGWTKNRYGEYEKKDAPLLTGFMTEMQLSDSFIKSVLSSEENQECDYGYFWHKEMFIKDTSDEITMQISQILQKHHYGIVLPDNWHELSNEEALAWVQQKDQELEEAKQAKEHIRTVAEQIMAPDSKPTNPKDLIGSNKVPLGLFPDTAIALGSVAMLEGALKYGKQNFRAIGVKASIYYDACRRHMGLWFDGEENDPDSGLPHLAHALACIAIIIDADYSGKLIDDRSFNGGGFRKLLNFLTPLVSKMREKYSDRSPKHWSIKDNL